jgi:outer membrane protein TolC
MVNGVLPAAVVVRALVFLLVASVSAPVLAAEEALDLAGALGRAIQRNPDLAREVASIDVASAQVLRSSAPYDLTLAGEVTYSRVYSFGGLAQNTPIDTLLYGVGISRGLETAAGATLTLGLQGARSAACRNLGGITMPSTTAGCTDLTSYQNGVSLQLTHPLLRGFGLETARRPRMAAEARVTAADANRRARAASLVRDTVLAYWELAYAVEDVQIKKEARNLATEQLQLTQAQIAVGRLSQVEEYAVRATIATREEELMAAELAVRQRSRDLRRQLGELLDAALPPFRTNAPPVIEPPSLDPAHEAEQAVAQNPALAALREGVRAAELDRQIAENLLLPDLAFVGSVGTTGTRDTVGDSFKDAVTLEAPQWSAGLRFSWQLGSRDARGQRDAAAAGKRRAEIDVTALELDTRTAAIRYADEAATAARRLQLSKVAVEFAEKNLQAEKAKFEVGRTTNYEVLRRQQELVASQIRRVRAVIDYLGSQAALLGVSGKILAAYGVKLK